MSLRLLRLKNGKFADHNSKKNNVLDPWPWTRPFLSMALRWSVLKKSIPGLRVFLSSWPQRLRSRLHLC